MNALLLPAGVALAYAAAACVGLPDRFCAMITDVVVTQQPLDSTLSAGRDRILGTMLGAAASLGVILAARAGAPLLPMFGVALVPLAVLTAIWPTMRLSCITLIIAVLVQPKGLSLTPPLDRVLEILLGTVAAVVVSAIKLPEGGK